MRENQTPSLDDLVVEVVLWENRHNRDAKKKIRLSWIVEFLRFQAELGQKLYIINMFHPETREQRTLRVDSDEYFRINRLWRKSMNGEGRSQEGIIYRPRQEGRNGMSA